MGTQPGPVRGVGHPDQKTPLVLHQRPPGRLTVSQPPPPTPRKVRGSPAHLPQVPPAPPLGGAALTTPPSGTVVLPRFDLASGNENCRALPFPKHTLQDSGPLWWPGEGFPQFSLGPESPRPPGLNPGGRLGSAFLPTWPPGGICCPLVPGPQPSCCYQFTGRAGLPHSLGPSGTDLWLLTKLTRSELPQPAHAPEFTEVPGPRQRHPTQQCAWAQQ